MPFTHCRTPEIYSFRGVFFFITSSCFSLFSSLYELHFSGKIVVLCLYDVYDPREIKGSFPPYSCAPPPLSLCPFSHSMQTTDPPPLPPPPRSHDPLTSSCFSCCRRQLSKCLRGGLLSFSLSSDRSPKLNPVARLKTWTVGARRRPQAPLPQKERGDVTRRHIRLEEMQNNVRGNAEGGKICSERCQQSKHV